MDQIDDNYKVSFIDDVIIVSLLIVEQVLLLGIKNKTNIQGHIQTQISSVNKLISLSIQVLIIITHSQSIYTITSQAMQQYHHADQIIRPYQSHAIYIGDLTSAQQISWLKENKIKTVITAAEGVTLNYDKTFHHIHYKLQDTKHQNISKVLEDAADKIQKCIRNGSVLVHCGAGVSRSTTLVIGYLIKYKKMTFIEALRLTKAKRPVVCPNLGFELQLKSFEKLIRSRQLIASINKKNIELPEIQKTPSNQQKHRRQKNNKFVENLSQLKNINKNVGGGFVVKKLPIRRQYSLVVGNKGIQNRQIQSNGFQVVGGNNRYHGARQVKDVQYLKKIAMFRFGITNTQKWKLG